jgi:glutaminyl-peptide cyclotransferase
MSGAWRLSRTRRKPGSGVHTRSRAALLSTVIVVLLRTRAPTTSSSFSRARSFQWHGGELLEGTGMNGESVLRRVSLSRDAYTVLGQVPLAASYFGEGICVWTDARGTYGPPGRDVVFQITWQERTGFVYDASTLEKRREFSFTTTVNQGEKEGGRADRGGGLPGAGAH